MVNLHDLLWSTDKSERLLQSFRHHFVHWERFLELLYKLRYPVDTKTTMRLSFDVAALLRASHVFVSLGYVVYMSKSVFKNHQKFMFG